MKTERIVLKYRRLDYGICNVTYRLDKIARQFFESD